MEINVTVPPNGLRHSLTQNALKRGSLGLLPQLTLGDTLKHLDSVITIICLPFGTMLAKFVHVDENRSSTLLT